METLASADGLSIPRRTISEIRLLSAVARANGSLLSLRDIAALTDTELTEEQIEACWQTVPDLACSYDLKNGFIIEREQEKSVGNLAVLDIELEKRARGCEYAAFAKKFASLLGEREANLIAISGSASYQAVSETDDLDFFCITKPESLWIFLAKSLLISRFFRLSTRQVPRICFSYVVDQAFADREFRYSNDVLFARDALTTIVIRGVESYKRLLKRSSWISTYFPRLYQRRTNAVDMQGGTEEPSGLSPARSFLNLLLWFLVGNYIGVKSAILNRKFKNQGRSSSMFTVRMGRDHCIFESARYSDLRALYHQLDGKPSHTDQGNLVSR